MGILDGQMARSIYAGFKGKLSKGQLRRMTAGTLNDEGDRVDGSPILYPLEGFTAAYSDFIRGRDSIPASDLKVNIFGKSIPDDLIPTTDDQVQITRAGKSAWYQLRSAKIDPAGALWVCRAFPIPAPIDPPPPPPPPEVP